MTARRWWLGLVVALCFGSSHASPSVRVLALFPDKAMLEIDGKRNVLSVGQSPQDGVRLISADTREAVVEIDGVRESLRLGSSVSARYQSREQTEIRVIEQRGSYFLDGLINGQPVRFLVDTGATSVALSELQADRLGLTYRIDGQPVGVGTAGGNRRGYRIRLRSLSVGGMRLNDVYAVVIEGDSPRHVLLGMNVLSRFDIDKRENLLILREKF